VAKRLVALIVLLVFLLLPTAAQAAGGGAGEEPEPEIPDGPFLSVVLIDNSEKDADGRGKPVPDVTLAATDADGQEVGTGTTDEEGRAIIEIPGRGTYTIELDEATLPEGVELSDTADTTNTVNALLNGANFAQFPIGTQEAETSSFGFQLQASLVSGLKFGLITALAALGLSLIFGTTGLTNFSHGDLITLGAILTYAANVGLGLPVIWAGVVAVLAAAVFGWVQERGLWRPLRHRGTGLIAMMIVSIGFGLFLRSIFQYVFGPQTRSLDQYTTQARQSFGPFNLAPKEAAIIITSIVVLTVTVTVLMKTRLGKAMRAVSDNPALAASSGMRVDGVVASAWILGTALTGLSGVLLAVNSQVNFMMGFTLLLLVFAGVTLGGLGTIFGAILGSLIIGLIIEVGPLFGVPSSIKEVGALVVLILVLLIRPQGILGRRERIG
jgi:neutral amino acid transport system permease protein